MPTPMPKVDQRDVSDLELVTLCKWYHDRCSDKSVEVHERLGTALSGFEFLATLIQARMDFEKVKHMQFRDYIRQPRVRDAAWEAGCNERGEL